MRLVIFDFDGTIHLKETPRLYLHAFKEDKLIRHTQIIKFYLSVAWVYAFLLVGHPVAVNPDPELQKEAQNRGWGIIYDVTK
jgi:phosphoserine phosphatase